MNIQCPNCGESLETPCEIEEGQHVLCPCCNVKFEYRTKQAFCPNCRQVLVLPHGVEEGQHLKCPYCEKVFTHASKADCQKGHERFPWGRLLVMSDFLWLSSIKRGTKGRCGRIEYALQLIKILFWLCMLGMMCHGIKKNAIAVSLSVEKCWTLLTIIPLVVFVVGGWSLVFASIRRLHDWNKAGWWVLTLIPVSLASGIVLSLFGLSVDPGTLNGGMLWFLLIAALLFPTVAENNRFGEAIEFHVPKPKVKHWVLFALITLIKVRILMAAVSFPCAQEAAKDVQGVAKDAQELATYVSSEKIKVDFDKLPGRIGAFGFKWGEKSRDLKHKYSCSIVYSVPYNGMYTMMELAYNSKGELFGITFKGPAQQQYVEPNFDSNYAREAAMKSMVVDGFLPLFNILKTHAEQVLDQHIQWTFDSDRRQFLGMTDLQSGCGYAGIVRLEVKSSGGVQLLSIFKN